MDLNKDNIFKWFLTNFHTHTDWTGSYVEYINNAASVEEVVNKFFIDFGIKRI